MLFPRAPGGRPAHRHRPHRRRRGPARGLVAGRSRPTGGRRTPTASSWSPTARACRCSGEHARGRFTRPHLRGHRVGGRRRGRTWFRPSARRSTTTRLVVRAEDARRRPGAGLRAGGGRRRRAARPGHGDQHRRGRLRRRRPGGRAAPAPTTTSSCSTSPAVTSASAAPQRHTVDDGLWLREGLRRPPRAGRRHHGRGRHGRASPPRTASVVGVHVGWSGNSVLRVERTAAHGATIGGGEHLLPGEVVLPTGASYASPWVYFAAADDGLDGLAAALARLPALARRPPGASSRSCSTSGRRSSSTTTSTGCTEIADRAARVGRGAVRARRRLVPRPARRHRRARRLGRRRAGLARRAGPAHRPRAGARHGVRALVRAGDGQPRLRPLPRAPGVDPVGAARPRRRCCTATSRSST